MKRNNNSVSFIAHFFFWLLLFWSLQLCDFLSIFRLAHLTMQNVNKDYVMFSHFCNFVAKIDQEPKTKNGMNETYVNNWDTLIFYSRFHLWIIPAPSINFFPQSNHQDGSNQRSIQPKPSSLRSWLWPSFSVKSREPGSSALVSVWFWSFNDFNWRDSDAIYVSTTFFNSLWLLAFPNRITALIWLHIPCIMYFEKATQFDENILLWRFFSTCLDFLENLNSNQFDLIKKKIKRKIIS